MKSVVKICGLANEADVAETAGLLPDAMGFIFWPKSKRGVTALEVAAWTRNRVPENIRKVGVFVDSSLEEILNTVETAGLDVVQLHGEYPAEVIEKISVPVWRVLHVDRLPADWNDVSVEALLVDSGTVQMPGGTGVQVDRDRARELVRTSKFPVLLAGGLKADTVSDIIKAVSPAGVDVSSGVELHPGKKDPDAVKRFLLNARSAFETLSR